MNLTFSQALKVFLTAEAHGYAELFAAEQATPEKGKQVYLNTLAVVAVQTYLKFLDIQTAIHQGDCWYPGSRAIFNVADLVLSNIGKVECRPVFPGEKELFLPPEVIDNRIGYIAVQFEEDLNQVQILGFVSARNIDGFQDSIPLTQIESLDALIEEIDWCKKWVNLRRWFEGFFPVEWQSLQSLSTSSTRSLRVSRDSISQSPTDDVSISCGKIINWGSGVNEQTTELAVKLRGSAANERTTELAVKLTDKFEEEIDICVRLSTTNKIPFLPAGLRVQILDESGNSCMEAEAREADDWIQLEFGCKPQEKFTIEMSLNEQIIRENFVV
ncbi:DUF1822 family protein [Okeania sp. SIO1I7]|uniref:DUF1822 family protein n=1 Tax=Okeania sp. SIO1I7 TaxID=2607772 RepID=UPI0013FCEB64|nr:DUF1822 family protein [Okeania sp. SIO1I7]NET24160.1 DUF1822 family protein [Okeania sp. SIO1I7]